MKPHLSRRQWLTRLSGAGAAALLGPPAVRAAGDLDPRVAGIVRNTISIDAHNHIDVPLAGVDQPGPDIDLAGEMRRSGLSAICMTFALDYTAIPGPGVAYDRFLNGMSAFDVRLRRNGMTRALNFADLRRAHDRRQPVVVQSVEGAHFLEGRLERLEEAYGRGLRHLTLLHDTNAAPPLGDIFTSPPALGGLTPLGADVIRECNRLGILVDLTHCAVETATQALKVTTRPVVFSHTGLNTQLVGAPELANFLRPRLISKEHARFVADAGGVIGVWAHLADSAVQYVRNVRAMVDVVGIDHVCIGTDTKLTPALGRGGGPLPATPPPTAAWRAPLGARTGEIWTDEAPGFYPAIVDAMLKAGFTAGEIAKVGGGNFCRVFAAATGG